MAEIDITLLPKTNRCFVCGPDNPDGLHVPFFAEGSNGSRAVYVARAEHTGWPGILHGGVMFALMDEALAYALYFQNLWGVTAKVQTRFRQPISVGANLIIRAWTLERRRQLVDARAEIRIGGDDGPVVAETQATMFLQETPHGNSTASGN